MDIVEKAKNYLLIGWNDRNFDFLEEIIDPTYHPNWMLMEEDGAALTIREIKYITSAISDYEYEIVDYARRDNKVWIWYRATGTHTGNLFGFAATNKKFSYEGASVMFFNENGLLQDRKGFYCFESIFHELGLSPPYWELHKYVKNYSPH